MPAADLFDAESLLTALDEGAPAGPDLEYDPAFVALEQAGAGTPERQYGDKVFPAEPPDWRAVHEHALALAARTRDLRVAVWLTRSGARLQGLAGALAGLQLVQGLLERHWNHAHPQLDASDNNDPTMRLNALAPLYAPEAALADLRAATLGPVRGGLTLRDLELGLGRAEPHGDETQPTEAGVLQALEELLEKHGTVADTLAGLDATGRAIADAVQAAVDSRAADATPLLKLLGTGPVALAHLRGEASEQDDSATDAGESAGGQGAGGARGGALRTRADAARELERIAVWIEQHEPTNPAPLLVRRAVRLMDMSFIDIIRDMASGGLDQVETIAGRRDEG